MRLIATLFIAGFAACAPAQDTPITVSAGGAPVLALRVPRGAKVATTGGHTAIQTPSLALHLWTVAGAKTPDDALPGVAGLIQSEFVNFKATATNTITISGAPARQLLGSGTEADDGDPGNAEVVLFAVGGRVFAACVHGELDQAAKERAAMLAVLQTARVPPK
jgi:hypothetical protein